MNWKRLYSFDTLKRDVRSTLIRSQVSETTTSDVIALIESEQSRGRESLRRLSDAIAIYQGHATLGKIINVVLHEGRRPLSYFRNHFPLLRKRADVNSKQTENSTLIAHITGGCSKGYCGER